jgi:molybdopterin molybdotransferase
MISLDEAQARLLALGGLLPVESVDVRDAVDRWAAADIVAKRTQPTRDLSAMDGYAVAHSDVPGPWQVIGESAAGNPFSGSIRSGQAVRIFTGAALPAGAGCVVIQEDVVRNEDIISIDPSLAIREKQHVRAAGSDFQAGQIIVASGAYLTPARIALAIMGGHATLLVRRRARVEIISTGDELVPPGADAGDDRLPSSNAIMLAAMLRDLPCDVHDMGIIPDDLGQLTTAISAADADIIVTSGGASVGDHDLVRPALLAAGATIDFWKIAMRPGKPLMAGELGDCICLGLPGNPVSAYVTALLFLKPLIRSISGSLEPLPTRKAGILRGSLPATGPRTDHVRATISGTFVEPTGPNDSAALVGLASADALIVRPANSPLSQDGDQIDYIELA